VLRVIVTGAASLIAGLLLGAGITMAAVGLLPVAVGGSLSCSVNSDGTVTSCTNDQGQQVKVPHHIRVHLPSAA